MMMKSRADNRGSVLERQADGSRFRLIIQGSSCALVMILYSDNTVVDKILTVMSSGVFYILTAHARHYSAGIFPTLFYLATLDEPLSSRLPGLGDVLTAERRS